MAICSRGDFAEADGVTFGDSTVHSRDGVGEESGFLARAAGGQVFPGDGYHLSNCRRGRGDEESVGGVDATLEEADRSRKTDPQYWRPEWDSLFRSFRAGFRARGWSVAH